MQVTLTDLFLLCALYNGVLETGLGALALDGRVGRPGRESKTVREEVRIRILVVGRVLLVLAVVVNVLRLDVDGELGGLPVGEVFVAAAG